MENLFISKRPLQEDILELSCSQAIEVEESPTSIIKQEANLKRGQPSIQKRTFDGIC